MFRVLVISVLGFIAAAVVTYLAVVVGTLVAWDLLGVHDQDGGGAMAVGLVIGPACAVIGGVIGAVTAGMWAAGRRRNAPPETVEIKKRDLNRIYIVGGMVAGAVAGHYVAQAGFWIASPISFDSYWKAWAVSWVPMIVTLLGAVGGGFLARYLVRG